MNNNFILMRIPFTHYGKLEIKVLLPNTSKFIYGKDDGRQYIEQFVNVGKEKSCGY